MSPLSTKGRKTLRRLMDKAAQWSVEKQNELFNKDSYTKALYEEVLKRAKV